MSINTDELLQRAKEIIVSWEIEKGHDHLEKWLAQFDDTQKWLMLTLLCSFHYYTRNQLAQDCKTLFREFTKKITNWDDKKTVFTKIFKDAGQPSHSEIFYNEFLRQNNIYNLGTSKPEEVLLELPEIERLVIVDDFAGSGKSFIKTIKKIDEKVGGLSDKKIYLLIDHCTTNAKENIELFLAQNGYTFAIFFLKESNKAFKEKTVFDEKTLKEAMALYGILVKKFPVSYPFGYAEIQALVSFYYNTPNNTLGLFWQKLDNYFSFFDRYCERRVSLREMIRKGKAKPVAAPIRDIDNYRVLLFTAYCVNKGSEFDAVKACEDFGFTETQLTQFLEYIVTAGYVTNIRGKFVETDLLSEKKFKCRFAHFLEIFDNQSCEKIVDILNREYTPLNFSKIFQGYKKGG